MEPRHDTRLGQHFLREPRIARRIVEAAGLERGHRVLEIGPGGGVLTEPLVEAVAPDGLVVAVEADARFARPLRDRGLPCLTVVDGDALRVELAALGPFDRIVANLPYQISGPITVAFLDLLALQGWGRAVLMYQKEFADRLLAPAGSKAYGRLSVYAARHCAVTKLRDVPPGCFDPPPKVHSTVVVLEPHDRPPFHVADDRLWHAVIDGAFGQRRKQMRNTVAAAVAGFGIGRDKAIEALGGMATLRPEQVPPADFAALVDRLVAA